MTQIYFFFTLSIIMFAFGLISVILYLRKSFSKDQSAVMGHWSHVSSKTEGCEAYRAFDVHWPATIITNQKAMEGEIKNISRTGAFIVCLQPLPLKQIFYITIRVPRREPIKAVGKVIWSNTNLADDQVLHRGMRSCFVLISGHDRKFIDSLDPKTITVK